MIEPKLHFLQKEPKVLFPASMVHLEPALGKAPEVLDPVDMAAALSESAGVVYADMMEPL